MIISPNNMIIRYFDEEIDIIKEKHQVSINNQIQLEYIANSEIDITILLNGKEIKDYEIDYNSGTIQFTTDTKKQFVEVSYTAIGEWLISSAKVYTNYDNKENILETLEDLINEQYKIIESIKVIGDVQTIILQMQANIDNLMALYDAVLHSEEILKNVDERIKECIAKKDELVTAINNSIQLGNTAKAQLDSSISTANTTKTDLVNTTTTCKADINKLVTDSKSDMTTTVNNHKKTVTDFTATKQSELTSTATTCVNNVNTATTIANVKLGELNQWVQDNGDIVDLNNRIINIKNHIFHNNEVKIIAHRGFSGYAPENTIPAFRLAGSNKYWGAECDVCETSDGNFVIMHDLTVDRTTNGTGTVVSKTLAQIKALNIDFGNFVTYNPTLKVPSLEEYLTICKECSLIPVIEIKNIKSASISKFMTILKKYKVLDTCMIISFDKPSIETIRSLDEKVEIAYLSNTMTADDITYCENNRFNINVSSAVITKALIEEAHSKNILVGAWTIDDKTEIKTLISNGVDFITTNGYIRGNEYELHRPYVEAGGYHYGRHTYEAGKPYEHCHTGNLDDKTRIWSDKLNKLEGWETKVGVPINVGYTVTVLFYDENKLGIGDLGWITNGSSVNIPSNAVYYDIYLGTPDGRSVELSEWINLRKIRAILF